jgi:tetratricopeptide (TPR) repeat protein
MNRNHGRRAGDWLLTALLTAIAFLLGCYEMSDSDIWWHLSGGRWILQHGQVPGLDPFTFGSEDRLWVDIHWGFQVLMSGIYSWGGAPGLILAAASVGGLTFLTAATARRREWPITVCLLCWAPALFVMSWRFDPRPEIFTLLYIACFLAVLWRLDRRPALVWLLVPLQIAWVNTQGLFILGPILVAFYLSDKAFVHLGWRWRGPATAPPLDRFWLLTVGAGALAVVGACFLNPYGLDGVRFPLDLFPKVTEPGNVYKEYIDELASARQVFQKAAEHNWYPSIQYFLLALLPVSFLLPATWRAWKAAPTRHERGAAASRRLPGVGAWLGVFLAAVGLLLISALCFLSARKNHWAGTILGAVPFGFVAMSLFGTWYLGRRSRAAAALALVGGLAQAIWIAWLRSEFHSKETHGTIALVGIVCLAAVALTLYHSGSLFRILLALAFGYLSLEAVQNASRFALIAGMVLTWNLGEWIHELYTAGERPFRGAAVGAVLRLGLGAALLLWLGALLTDQAYAWTGSHFLFRERPFEFAHDAIRFAGQAAQPPHALVYDLAQTGLFDYYNAPAHKPFMDGRLEMPSRETFQTYVNIEKWLEERDPRWEAAVRRLGDPLILLTHQPSHSGEAILLTHPGWRCIYWDALAAVFVPRGRSELERSIPTIDFAARHFHNPQAPSVPNLRGAVYREARSLSNLATELRRDAAATWTWRIPASLLALNRGALGLAEDDRRASTWMVVGNCYRNLISDIEKPAPTPAADPWDPAAVVPWAQATYCYRRAIEQAPGDVRALRDLISSLRVRRMEDEHLAVVQGLTASGQATPAEAAEFETISRNLSSAPAAPGNMRENLATRFNYLLRHRRPKAAAQLADEISASDATWALADHVAPLYLHLGRPADARRFWRGAAGAPSKALRQSREALTYWIERDFERAAELYRRALAADSRLGEACWGLAMLSAQLGLGPDTLEYCERGLRLDLTERQRSDLEGFKTLARK